MIDIMKLASQDGTLNWEQFRQMITTLLPLNLED